MVFTRIIRIHTSTHTRTHRAYSTASAATLERGRLNTHARQQYYTYATRVCIIQHFSMVNDVGARAVGRSVGSVVPPAARAGADGKTNARSPVSRVLGIQCAALAAIGGPGGVVLGHPAIADDVVAKDRARATRRAIIMNTCKSRAKPEISTDRHSINLPVHKMCVCNASVRACIPGRRVRAAVSERRGMPYVY